MSPDIYVSVVSHKTDILMTYRGMSVGNVDSGEWFDDSTDQQINWQEATIIISNERQLGPGGCVAVVAVQIQIQTMYLSLRKMCINNPIANIYKVTFHFLTAFSDKLPP